MFLKMVITVLYSSVYTYFGVFSSVYTYFGVYVHSLVSPISHTCTQAYTSTTHPLSHTLGAVARKNALTSLIGIQHWLIPVQDASPITPVDS